MSEKRKSPPSVIEQKTKKATNVIVKLNDNIISKTTIDDLSSAWKTVSVDQKDTADVEYYRQPYRHCVLKNFIQDADFIKALQEELMDLDFSEKNNDLYKFHQSTEDLKTSKSENICAFRQTLCTAVRDWLIQVTDVSLNQTIDTFCAQYIHTDTLLCHDDELEGRRFAYIYYLVNNWTGKDGGALDLFDVDDNLQPSNIVKSLVPVRNNFVFFEVTPGSYHQVAEILSEDKTRLSISGWFHGPPIQRPSPYIEPPRALEPYGTIQDDVFFDWINPLYMNVNALGSIQEKFEQDSEIELQDFIVKEKYESLMEAIKSSQINWKKRGPANKRCYELADESDLPNTVKTCLNLLKSDAMFLLLSNLTGLKLHEMAGESSDSESNLSDEDDVSDSKSGNNDTNVRKGRKDDATVDKSVEKFSTGASSTQASTDKSTSSNLEDQESANKPCTSRCRTEVRHWTHQCYTLVHDTDSEGSEFALDLVLYLGVQDWEMEYGGFTSYIARGEDEELLTVTPQSNSLALVYRDKETLKFVKYLNSGVNKMSDRGFYDISAVYYE